MNVSRCMHWMFIIAWEIASSLKLKLTGPSTIRCEILELLGGNLFIWEMPTDVQPILHWGIQQYAENK